MKAERMTVYGFPGRRFLQWTVAGWQWDWFDWSLSRSEVADGHLPLTFWQQKFSLRCGTCRAWTLGCGKHLLCGQCPTCVPREDE